MNVGDIVFVRGHTPISSIIRAFDKGEFSHVALAVSPTRVVEAEWSTKVRIAPMEYEDFQIVRLSLTDEQRELLIKTAIQYCGKVYDFKAILSFMLKGKVSLNNPNAFICSELVTSILSDVGSWSSGELVSPNELYRRLFDIGTIIL